MRHYILTRCAYGRDVPLEVNQQRLTLLRGVTARSLRAQTARDITWLVLIDLQDPLLSERRAVIESAGLPTILAPAGRLERSGIQDRPYGPWARHIKWGQQTLTTRLDDDDALAPFAMERVQAAALAEPSDIVWTLPTGYRVAGRRVFEIRWPLAQFGTLAVPASRRATIFDVSHQLAANLAPLMPATDEAAWLWVRHPTTRSRINVGRHTMLNGRSESRAMRITSAIRAQFPIDWPLVEAQA